jgi:hypothetical protein
MDERIEVFVLAAPNRPEAHRRCYRSIEESDIGEDYTVCENPPGLGCRQHWKETHERAARSDRPFVMVLEDDVVVNRHILHNCRTWKWKHDQKFGAGWLFRPGGVWGTNDDWYPGYKWFCTQGVLYPTALLPKLIAIAWGIMQAPGREAWDVAISHAVWRAGLRIRMHGPALVEHIVTVPSAIGNPNSAQMGRSSNGTFSKSWKRPT